MDAEVREKIMKILRKELKYRSSSPALNKLISELRKKLQSDPGCMEECMKEMDGFLHKYPIVAKVDLANIAAL